MTFPDCQAAWQAAEAAWPGHDTSILILKAAVACVAFAVMIVATGLASDVINYLRKRKAR